MPKEESKVELTEEDKEELSKLLQNYDPEKMRPLLIGLSELIRATQGKEPKKDDFISGLMNIKDIRERTRFVNQVCMKRQIYFRVIGSFCEEVKEEVRAWMDEEATELIAYKGLGRSEAIDYKKAEKAIEAGQSPNVFLGQIQREPERKRRFWSRSSTPEPQAQADRGGE